MKKTSSVSNAVTCSQIIQGDCTKILPQMPRESVDLVFADPPYNLQLSQDLWRPNQTLVNAVNDEWDKFSSFEEYDHFTHNWLSGVKNVLKDTGTLWVIGTYHNIYRVGTILQDMGFWILNDIIYIKANPMPNFRGVRFTNSHETLIWAQKKKGSSYTFNHHAMKSLNDELQMRSDWFINTATGKERIKINGKRAHSSQKPEALLYRIILSSTKPGDLILDPFFGTGTTGAVAKKLGREYIGIERNEKYIQIAKDRIDSVIFPCKDTINFTEPRSRHRIPIGALLENSLLTPGQTLYFIKDNISGTLLADGNIKSGELTGSIHAVARSLSDGAPINGWECWFFRDDKGNLNAINTLRQQIRQQIEKGNDIEIPEVE